LGWAVAADRDERRYPEPDAFDTARNPAGHLGFG
jgi:cytochrome P450